MNKKIKMNKNKRNYFKEMNLNLILIIAVKYQMKMI